MKRAVPAWAGNAELRGNQVKIDEAINIKCVKRESCSPGDENLSEP